jgi:hypothetical protein
LHILSRCAEPRTASDLDATTNAHLEGQRSVHTPAILRRWLEDAGGLAVTGPEQGGGADAHWRLTPAGRIALDAMNLSRELTSLLDRTPEHRPTYLEILRFCAVPRTTEEIETHLDGDPSIRPPKTYPSTVIAPLEDVGALRWVDKWMTTDLGRQACV